jgi:hypothetical protein
MPSALNRLTERLWPLLMMVAVAAPAGRRPANTAHASAINAALDSCNRATYRRQDHPHPAPLTATIRSFGRFSIAVPRGARLLRADTVNGHVAIEWPGCPKHCHFTVTLESDSGRSADRRVAALIEEQRKIDSLNRVPGGVGEFSVIDGQPQRVQTAAGLAWLIDNDCGDCLAYTLLIGRRGQIGSVDYSGDDMQPSLPIYHCEMKAVALTFAWRPAKP